MVRCPTHVLVGLLVVFVFAVFLALASEGADAAQWDVELKLKDELGIKRARGLNPITFNYTVKHTGDVLTEEVYLTMEDVPPMWQVFLSVSTRAGVGTAIYKPTDPFKFLLERGEVANLSITVTPPVNALNNTYWMTVKVWPRKDPTQEDSHTFAVIVPQWAGGSLVLWNPPSEGEYQAIPPSTVTVRLAFYNTGNGVDRFLIRAECSRSHEGWTPTFASGVDEFGFTPNLTSDMNKKYPHFIDIKIPIPAGTRAGVTAQIMVNATSMFDPSKDIPPVLAIVSSLQYYNFQVYTIGPIIKRGIPGEEVEFELKINNLGNGWDTFTIKPIWDEELNPGFIASANPRSIDIDRDTNDTVLYIVKVPPNPPYRTYLFSVDIASSSPDLDPVTKSFEVEIGQHYGIALTTNESRMGTLPGGILDYEVIVKNIGNDLDSIIISLTGVPSSWLTYIQPPEVNLLQAEEAIIKIRVIISPRWTEATMGIHSFTVMAKSSRSDAQASLTLDVEILQFFRVEWMYNDEPITDPSMGHQGSFKSRQSINPREKDTLDITLEVKNFGNGNDNVTFTATSPESRITGEIIPARTLLLRDQTKLVKLTITIATDIAPGSYAVFASVSSQDSSAVPRVIAVEFEVVGVDVAVPPVPTYLHPTEGPIVMAAITVSPGTDVAFTLDVINKGTLPVDSVKLRWLDNYEVEDSSVSWNFFNVTVGPIAVGDHIVVGEGPFTEGNPELVWRASSPGVHVLEFRVSCQGQTEGANDVSTVTVNVRAPPRVVLDDEDLEIRKGENLTVTGTAGDGTTDIEWVRGRVDGGEWVNASGTSEWTLEFESGSLDKGSHTLEVVAFDGDVESPVLETTFEVEPAYKVEDTPGLGVFAALMAIAGASAVVIGRTRKG
jgi:uncharacterized membrane protein